MIPEKPKPSKEFEYEKVPTDDFVVGSIAEVQYDDSRLFPGYQDRPEEVTRAVRFKFDLEGCQFAHFTKWMRFKWHEKSALYKFLEQLIDGISKDQPFDIDCVQGMKVKTLWANIETPKGVWQNLDKIRPLGGAMKIEDGLPVIDQDHDASGADLRTPF